jgi:hypothetical protein
LDGADAEFRVGVGSGAHAKQQFRIGDSIEGVGFELRIRNSKSLTSTESAN